MLKPYKYQQEIIDRFKNDDCAGLFCEPGVGKTIMALNLLRFKCNQHRQILPTLIFCPSIVIKNWKDEILQCTKIPADAIGLCIGSKKQRLKIIEDPKHRVLVINYEADRKLDEKKKKPIGDIFKALMAFDAKVVIYDESHVIKSPKSAVFKVANELSIPAWYRYILSGTPITKQEDAWSQYMVMDRGKTFGPRFYAFKSKYYVNLNKSWTGAGSYPDWQFNTELHKEFKQLIADTSVTLRREDCLDMPDLVETTIHVKPTKEQEKHYKEIKRDLITWIKEQEDNPLVVKNALVKALRLAEVLSGYLRLEDQSIVKLKVNPKLDALMDLLDNLGDHKVIIYCVFKQNYIDIAERLEKQGIKYLEIHGGVSTKQKIANADEFERADSDVRVVIVNPRSGGVGINLKAAPYAIYYTMSYSYVDFEQSRARNYRAGSKDLHEKIVHYYLTHQGLADDNALKSVRNKKEVASSVLDVIGTLI